MKRSEINKCIKEFEAVLKEHKFELPPFLSFTLRNGPRKAMSMMRSVTMLWAGISPIMVRVISMMERDCT